jgi:hypothetical protein
MVPDDCFTVGRDFLVEQPESERSMDDPQVDSGNYPGRHDHDSRMSDEEETISLK